MGNGNGRSDVLYALVDDVTDLKILTASFQEQFARIDARFARIDARFDGIEANMLSMRKTQSDMMALMQTMADKLVSISERLDDHERRLVRIEALLTSGKK